MSDGAKRTRVGFNSYTEKLCVVNLDLRYKKISLSVFFFVLHVNRAPLESMKYNNLPQPCSWADNIITFLILS